ncbi:putative sulfate exporter family transporter [Hydrogenibacillus schlegelii]|uniref:YeiH family protein n=2 Tax=Hydrogenibacillus schlegelii TaxID=1484 RepID=UPI001FDFDBC4|nr:putative sulfate exporter family transporter [Hydrogenibacillus schlegelii]
MLEMEQKTAPANARPAGAAPVARLGWLKGVILTLFIAYTATSLARLPGVSVMGPLVIAILLGMAWRGLMDIPTDAAAGIRFASQKLLRAGIVLLGMRLSLSDIARAGVKVPIVAGLSIAVAMGVALWIARQLNVERRLGMLTACGTAICGAAAVVAVAPQIKANESETAAAAAAVALLGTAFTLLDLALVPLLPWGAAAQGMFLGGTLHEIAHVVAASFPFGEKTADTALIVKLTRVALLVPVALAISALWRDSPRAADRTEGRRTRLGNVPVPWFILGFLGVAVLHTWFSVPEGVKTSAVQTAYFLLAMAMAGLGLSADWVTLRRLGTRALAVGGGASLALSLFDAFLVSFLRP